MYAFNSKGQQDVTC